MLLSVTPVFPFSLAPVLNRVGFGAFPDDAKPACWKAPRSCLTSPLLCPFLAAAAASSTLVSRVPQSLACAGISQRLPEDGQMDRG